MLLFLQYNRIMNRSMESSKCLSIRYTIDQRFPTCGSRPHVGSPSIFIGVATGRQTFLKIPCTIAHPQCSLFSVKNCALSKLITYILYSIIYRSQYHQSFKFCVCYIFFYSSTCWVAIRREHFFGIDQCTRLEIAGLEGHRCTYNH